MKIKVRAFFNGTWHDRLGDEGEINSYFEKATMPIVQYIGMKDKNGTELYVGDIVQFWWQDAGSPARLVTKEIIFDEENLCFCLKYSRAILACQFSHEHEKVGTVFENPELLTD